MAERVIVRQNSRFETAYQALDPADPRAAEPHPVEHLKELTPYGMLLASLGTCTSIVLHTYAQHHNIALDEVKLTLEYQRLFPEDCKKCEEIGEYLEQIRMDIGLTGDLVLDERERLFRVSRFCPIHKMLHDGVEVQMRMEERIETEHIA